MQSSFLYDVLIIGSGAAGLSTALTLNKDLSVAVHDPPSVLNVIESNSRFFPVALVLFPQVILGILEWKDFVCELWLRGQAN